MMPDHFIQKKKKPPATMILTQVSCVLTQRHNQMGQGIIFFVVVFFTWIDLPTQAPLKNKQTKNIIQMLFGEASENS